jgi:Mg-chelatase subunit ChlD
MKLRTSLILILSLFFITCLSASAQQGYRLMRNSSDVSNALNAFSAEPMPAPPRSTAAVTETPSMMVRIPQKSAESAVLQSGVTTRDLANIGRHDVILIIDKSGSMHTPDCPESLGQGKAPGQDSDLLRLLGMGARIGMSAGMGMRMSGMGMHGMGGNGISRWDWCKEQTCDLTKQTSSVLPQGLTVELFSNDCRIFPHVDLRQVPQLFAANSPGGNTNTATAVRRALEDYFNRRAATNGNVKPLLVAVITDGLPDNPEALKEVIVNATRQMTRADEIAITFLKIGSDPEGDALIEEMDHLGDQGARFNIVHSKTFPELIHTGLTRALVDCVRS